MDKWERARELTWSHVCKAILGKAQESREKAKQRLIVGGSNKKGIKEGLVIFGHDKISSYLVHKEAKT